MAIETYIFDRDRNDEIVRLLVGLGVRRNVAKILVYLSDVIEGPSKMIERGTDLRQPEVSVALKWLIHKGWAEVKEGRPERRGRPVKIFRLVRTLHEILEYIEEEKMREWETQRGNLKRLKEIIPVRDGSNTFPGTYDQSHLV